MNDPFFSVSSRRKLTASNATVAAKRPNNSFKSLKNMKTSKIIQKVHSKPSISIAPFALPKEASSSSSSSSEASDGDSLSQDENLDDATSRIKLAKKYIKSISKQEEDLDESSRDNSSSSEQSEGEIDAQEIDRDIISQRLIKDAIFKEGKKFSPIGTYVSRENTACSVLFGQKRLAGGQSLLNGPPSAVCTHSPSRSIFGATKKCKGIFQWTLTEDLRGISSTKSFTCNAKKALGLQAIAVSPDGEFLVGGGLDAIIHVWSLSSGSYLRALRHHRGPITGLCFRLATTNSSSGLVQSDLYSISTDRALKIWQFSYDPNEAQQDKEKASINLAYVDTLFGHQESPVDLCVLSKERCMSVGGRDRSARLWKVMDSTHLVFNAPLESGTLDLVCMLTESAFVVASESQELFLWNSSKKKFSFSAKLEHRPSSLAALPHSAIFASGDERASLKIWKCSSDFSTFEQIQCIQIAENGFISSISWLHSASIFSASTEKASLKALSRCAVAIALSREHRLGRWNVASSLPSSSQGVYVVGFSKHGIADEADLQVSSAEDSSLSADSESILDMDSSSEGPDLSSEEGDLED